MQRLNICAIMAYISDKSGEYDPTERDLIDDPYVLGYDAYNDGMSLEEALAKFGARPRSRHEVADERKRLIKKGFCDAENG